MFDLFEVSEHHKCIHNTICFQLNKINVSIVGNLTISPRYGPMLGGQYLVIGGPCIDNKAEIKVTFSELPKQKCYRISEFSMSCVTPMFNYTGDITVTVEIENNQEEKRVFRGIYTIRTYMHVSSVIAYAYKSITFCLNFYSLELYILFVTVCYLCLFMYIALKLKL